MPHTASCPPEPVPAIRRPALRTVRQMLRNPLEAWPPQVYREKLVRTSLLGQETVFVSDPELIGAVLQEHADAFHKAPTMQRSLRPVLGDAILTAEGSRWRSQRRAAAPVFRHDRLQDFVPDMLEAARRTRDRWLALPPGSRLSLAPEMMRTTYEIIAATMLSGQAIEVGRIERDMARYLRSAGWPVVLAMLRAPRWTPYPGRLRAARTSAGLRADLAATVAARRRAGSPHPDLLALLLEAADPETGTAMGDADIADNLLTFIFAGHETTAIAMCWTLSLLAEHPAIEAAVLAEIAAATGGAPVEAAHLPGLALTRQAVQEAIRLYPPAAVLVRIATRPLRIGPHAIAAGSMVYVPIYAVHRHAALWPDPERFDPDRFRPEAVRARHRYAYLPFGAGPRICIGAGFALQEAVAILATLLPAVRLGRPAGTPPPVPRLRITLRPADGMPMQVAPRG